MSRQVFFDTETTGLSPNHGDRIVEIGCIAYENRQPTGERFHVYLNPERDVPKEAENIHGLTAQFLADKPRFADIAREFCLFIRGAEVIAHNAPFDVAFLDHEMALAAPQGRSITVAHLARSVTDSLQTAKRKYPGRKNSLDAICDRLGIDRSNRQLHGALLDAELLASAYIGMTVTQASLFNRSASSNQGEQRAAPSQAANTSVVMVQKASEQERQQHDAFRQSFSPETHNEPTTSTENVTFEQPEPAVTQEDLEPESLMIPGIL